MTPLRPAAVGLAFALALGISGAARAGLCGPKPIPPPLCEVGDCVDGEWEISCHDDPFSTCGPKPIPREGCRIDDCVDGRWQQSCYGIEVEPDESPSCGIKPLPPGGCYVGDCVDGVWQMTCE